MPVTTLDPKTALIVIDLQKAIMAAPTITPPAEIAVKAAELAEAFRKHKRPVVLVNAGGQAPGRNEIPPPPAGAPPRAPDWNHIIPEMNQQPSDHLVTKKTWGAFTNTDLDAYLKKEGVTQVVICGIATSIGVESTARFAHELGYNVTLATDAMTDPSAYAHDNSLARVFPRIGESGSTADIIALLDSTHA